MKIVKVGIRPSKLAEIQAMEILKIIQKYNPSIQFFIKKIKTTGDYNKTIPLDKVDDESFFTRELDEALLNGEIDISIHSAKDLPSTLHPDFKIIFMSDSPNPYEALVSKNNLKLDELPSRAKIGTSSKSRKIQLKKYRKDFIINDIRGNIEERVNFLYKSDLNAIIIAAVALERLNLNHLITEIIPDYIIKPHPLQGRIAVVGRKDNGNVESIFKEFR